MSLAQWLQPPRRTIGLFVVTALALAVGLAWLGWRVVALDRSLEVQRTQERVGHALDLVTVTLQGWLDEIDRELAAVAAAPDAAVLERGDVGNPEADASVFLVIGPDGLTAVPEGRLAYYPESTSETSLASASSRNEAARASALLTEAASHNRSGRHDAALATYEELAMLSVTVPVVDAPAPIVASHARGLILEALGRREELRHEADRLWKAVRDPRYHVTRGVYDYYGGYARRWGGHDEADAMDDPAESMRVARSAIAGDLAEAWRRDPTSAPDLIARIDRPAGQAMVVVERRGTDGLVAFVAPTRVLETEVRKALVPDAHQVAVAILDAGGQVVVGEPPSSTPELERETRIASAAGLPWTLTAVPGADWTPDPDALARQRLVLMGVLLVALTVVAAASMAGRAMHRELEAARLQADFVAAVSHEFRTPLAAFGQITELLVDGRVAGEADRDEYYRRLRHETDRLRRLVEDLLDFRRMEAGAHEYRFEPVEVATLVRDVTDECQPDGPRPAPRIDFDGSDSSVVVRADREALARAVRNLIDNALKYAAGTPVIDVSVATGGTDVAIAVRDTGPGIEPAQQRTIFDKFVRAGGRRAAVRGTGLGLAMVRHIVAAHGGRIDLDSEIGRGSTFTIVLPAVGETATAAGEV